MPRPVVSLLTDFGRDGPAAICRGVILTIAPDAQIVDIGHNVRKYAIRDGARTTWQPTFGGVAAGRSLLYEDSFGLVSLADNQGDVTGRLALEPDRRVRIVAG